MMMSSTSHSCTTGRRRNQNLRHRCDFSVLQLFSLPSFFWLYLGWIGIQQQHHPIPFCSVSSFTSISISYSQTATVYRDRNWNAARLQKALPLAIGTGILDDPMFWNGIMDHVAASASSAAVSVSESSSMATVAVDSSFSSSSTSSNLLLSFADQGNNLAGLFFQASLLPYLVFLYFVGFRANRLSSTANFGFQFILMFVLSTIPAGIVCQNVYGTSLANVDWLHGGAELLLTLANVYIVLGLKDALTHPTQTPTIVPVEKSRNIAFAVFVAFIGTMVAGAFVLGVPEHSPFLFGLGNLSHEFTTTSLPWIAHNEPTQALSIPTWAIHWSSVFEYLCAMNLIWKYSYVTNNPAWKGLTWGMLPLHASGICACTYHFFYNAPTLQFLVSLQAALTFLGNGSCAYAAYRIARSNGWTLDEVNPWPRSATSTQGLIADGLAATPLQILTTTTPSSSSSSSSSFTTTTSLIPTTRTLVLQLVALTLVCSYGIKYGSLGLDVPFTASEPLALLLVVGIPALTAYQYYSLSDRERGGSSSSSSSSNNDDDDDDLKKNPLVRWFNQVKDGSSTPPASSSSSSSSLSMADVKKYGVSGTVAYVLTELAFWLVAFPVAAAALTQSTGHTPDVIHNASDRASVVALVFAGANVARLLVPLRLGAALALAPWVDATLLQPFFTTHSNTTTSITTTTTTAHSTTSTS